MKKARQVADLSDLDRDRARRCWRRGPSSREIAAPNDPQVSCPGRILSMAQFVYLVHHAQALSGETDHTRPLSTVGLLQAESVARAAVERGAKPTVIWHSGKLRARQTAEAWLRLVNPFA